MFAGRGPTAGHGEGVYAMQRIYYFKNGGRCRYTKALLEKVGPSLFDDAGGNGDKARYFINLEWISSDSMGADRNFFEKMKIPYINTADELPPGAGLLLIGYEGDIDKIRELAARGIPMINKSCPFTSHKLKNELQNVKPSHQMVLLIDKDHVVYRNYRAIIPMDAIIVDPGNYAQELEKNRSGKPLHFITYSTFRPKDIEKIISHIKRHYAHEENIFFTDSLCFFIKSGLLEEIRVKANALKQIWLISSPKKNRSLTSILDEIADTEAQPVLIHDVADIPRVQDSAGHFGVILAPMPYSKEKEILQEIKKLYGEEMN
jgi:4-hydroxy-3-methylbut-2-enyl diphosphate reductase IspH